MFRRLFQGDWILFSTVCLLLSIGLIILYSISSSFENQNVFIRQAVFTSIGMGIIFSFPLFEYRHLARFSTPVYFLMIVLLLGVLAWGSTIRGISGWIQIGGFQFQPVEISKIVLVIFLSSFIAEKRSELGDFVRLVASLVLSSLLIVLVLKQPDLGSALVLAGIWFGMVVVSGIKKRHLLFLGVLFSLVVSVGWFLLVPYQKERIFTFLSPERDPRGSGYNVIQALVAVGSGGVTGKGIGNGSQSQLHFLPERHTDFIYAVIAEELGMIGGLLVLALFGVMLWRMTRIALLARDNFGYLFGMGMTFMIFIQVVVNVGMNIGVLPVTGIPLPFLSYGGSSLLSACLGIAILQNIASKKRDPESFEWS